MRLRYGTLLVSLLAGATAAAPVSPGHSLAGQQAAAADLMAASAPAAPAPLRGSVPAAFATAQEPTEQPSGFIGQADRVMGVVNGWIGAVLFFDLIFWSDTQTLPFIVLWLIVAGIYLTLRMGFINFRGFRHAIQLTRGKYTDPSEPGDVTHFQALSTALSATVGLGNIAGVAIAVTLGGPGATFWMIVAGFIGMSTKFTECTLGQMYREIRPDGHVLGGPVQYLSKGFAERGMPGLGKVIAVVFALLCIGGSLAGGNSFQVNQSMNAIQETFPFFADVPWAYGLLMAGLVGIVILGGIRRIANVADKVVPFMAAMYVLASIVVILTNASLAPDAFARIFSQALAPDAIYGGFVGVIVVGFQRAAFSNEAGAGSAPIAHSAAKTRYPIREGTVALLEPFIDTVIICTMT
ncbi:MAG: alanine/glycine:cation symporter family protein, partial [Gemmatimonadota bacterium]